MSDVLVLMMIVAGAICFIGSPKIRCGWITLAPVFLLQSNSSVLKMLFLASVLYCLWDSREQILRHAATSREFKTALVLASVVLIYFIVITPAQVVGLRSADGARDALPYVFLCLIPPLGPIFGRLSMRFRTNLTWAVCIMAATSYFFSTLANRGAAQSDALGGFRSLALIALVSSLCIAKFIDMKPRAVSYLLVGEIAVGIAIASGTRTALALGILLLILPFFLLPEALLVVKWIVYSAMGGIVGFFGLQAIVARFIDNPNYYEQRYNLLFQALKGTASIHSDQSVQGRSIHYEMALEQIHLHPLFGTGTGFPYPGSLNNQNYMFELDTPWITVAKLGVCGSALLIWLTIAWLRVALASSELSRRARVYVVCAVTFFAIVQLPSGSIMEDKGLALGIMVLGFCVYREKEGSHESEIEEIQAKSANARHSAIRVR